MFSIIGLSLDVVGAVTLALGLFGHMHPGTWFVAHRRAEEAAHDAAFGLVGAPLLVLGFIFQALPYLGVRRRATIGTRIEVGTATLLGGALVAFFAYGAIYQVILERERRYAGAARSPGHADPPIRLRRLRFWLR